jgi:uncharacterized protein (DUF1697 family)
MPTHVALLRGINVGGRRELAAQLTRLGGSRTAETAGTARN